MNIKAIIERVRDRFSGRDQECDCDALPVVRIPTPEATAVEAVVVTTAHSGVPFLVGDTTINVAPGDDRVIWLVLNGTQEVVIGSFIALRDELAHPDLIAQLAHGVLATADPEVLRRATQIDEAAAERNAPARIDRENLGREETMVASPESGSASGESPEEFDGEDLVWVGWWPTAPEADSPQSRNVRFRYDAGLTGSCHFQNPTAFSRP